MARRYTTLKISDMVFGELDEEIELEVGDDDDDKEEYIDVQDSIVLEDVDEELIDESQLEDENMVEADGADEDDYEIDRHTAHRASEEGNLFDTNLLEDILDSEEGDCHYEWCKNLRDFPMSQISSPRQVCRAHLTSPPLRKIDFFRLFIIKEPLKNECREIFLCYIGNK